MSKQLFPQLKLWLDSAVEKNDMGEDVTYDLFPLLDPNNGSLTLYFMFSLPSIIIGQHVTAMVGVEFSAVLGLNEEAVNNIATNGLEQLRQARSQQAQVPDPAANGNGPGGIITP